MPSTVSKTTKAVGGTPTIFESEWNKLNPEQRRAVETIEGPVMVIAGPGTGKTQTVAMRVANILRKTQARPGNILCLTFSTSGATAMRDRLRLLIGPDAYGVTIATIHKFCADIIADHPALFDEWSALKQISDLEKFREVNTIIDQLLPDLALINPKNPYGRTKEILGRISDVKREGKTVEDLRAVGAQYAVAMGEKSRPGTKAHERNLMSVRKFLDFIEFFDRYQKMLQKTGRFDYDDMILYVIRALEREEWLLAGLQERYLYFLVDEFQDTNGAQYRVIELLTKPVSPEDRPNLFVVGDDDQAIYRFQGANLRNILSFHERFPSASVITLATSYRSTQPILDAANKLISHNTERLVGKIPGLLKSLKAHSAEEGSAPLLLRPPSDAAEPFLIADLVAQRLKSGIAPRDIGILVQTNRELRPLYDVLTGKGIAVRLIGKSDLLTHPLVLQSIAVLRTIGSLAASAALSDALGAACFSLFPSDLAHLYRIRREREKPLIDILFGLDQDDADLRSVLWKDRAKLLLVRDLLQDLSDKTGTRTIIETVDRAMRDCGLLPENGNIHPLDLAALQAFYDRVREWTSEDPSMTYDRFLQNLELYANPDYDIRLSFDAPHLVTDGVQLLTAHQSKGLEFHTVILANFREGHWDARRHPGSISLPEDLLFGWEKEQKAYEKNQDERRVAFVAMTRAKREVILSCPRELTAGDKTKSVSPSAFVAEAGPLPEEDRGITDPEHASLLLLNSHHDLDQEFRDFLTERLKTYALSATGLNRFLRDPQEFLRVDLLQVPQVHDFALAYGNAVHWALRQWALSVQRGEALSREGIVEAFRRYLLEREFLSQAQRNLLIHLGESALPRYFDLRLAQSVPFIDQVERDFTARIGAIPIKGKIDRIDRDAPQAAAGMVIDYKTGRPQSEAQIREGDYFRQLQFYAVLLERSYPSLTPRAFVLEFIGEREEHPVARELAISDEEKRNMERLIAAVWEKISNLDFSPLQIPSSKTDSDH